MWDKKWLIQYPLINFSEGESIIKLGDVVSYYYYLVSGICARTIPTSEGDEIIMEYFHDGDMLGLRLRQFGEESVSEFVARKPCCCYKIPWQDVEKCIREDSDLCYALYQKSTWEVDFWAMSWLVKALGGGISLLCLALYAQAKLQQDGSYLVDTMFTNMELSKYCGVHPVSISRFMTQLSREGILERKKSGIQILDMKKLVSYINQGE